MFNLSAQGRSAFWLSHLTSTCVANLAHDADSETEPTAESIEQLRDALKNPDKAGLLNSKIKNQKQPGLFSGAPKAAAPR